MRKAVRHECAGCGSHAADWPNPADQKLALAAPDLLEALEAALTILTDSVGDFDYDKAVEAIARATGELA